MAMKMAHTVKGALYPDAYWRIGEIRFVDREDKVRVQFDMYANEQARLNDKFNGVLAAKPYYLGNAEGIHQFEEMTGNEITAALYAYAKSFKEGTPPDTDANGDYMWPDTRVSFFETAEDIL